MLRAGRTSLRALLCLLLLAAGAWVGCGGDGVQEGVRIRLVTLDADGPFPLPAALRKEDEPGLGQEYALEATDEVGVFTAPGAPDGIYRVISPAHWGMLWTHPVPPQLERDPRKPPRAVAMGRPNCLYVTTQDARQWGVSAEWGMVASSPLMLAAAVPLTIIEQGGWVGLRVPDRYWRPGTEFRALGRMSDGQASQLISFTLPQSEWEAPRLALAHPAPTAPLIVRVVPAAVRSPAEVPDGTEVTVSQPLLPLGLSTTARTFRGVAVLDRLAALDAPLDMHVAGNEPAVTMSFGDWRRLGEAWLVGPIPQGELREVDLDVAPGAHEDLLVLVRAEGADVYAQACTREQDGKWLLRTGGGQQHIWLRVGREWRAGSLAASRQDATPATPPGARERVAFEAPQSQVRIRGAVPGAMAGQRVRFFRREQGRWVTGHGFEVGVTSDGYEALLPPGDYAVGIVRSDGHLAGRVEFALQAGKEVRRDLSVR